VNPIQIHPGIFRIRLPLAGKKPGPVNVYLFKGKDNVTLLDTGTAMTWRFLEKRLKTIGVTFRDIDRIVMSHGHVDHYGSARKVYERGGKKAKVFVHPADAKTVETGIDVPAKVYRRFLSVTGTPFRYHLGIVPMFLLFRKKLARPCPVHELIDPSKPFTLGDYTARIVETPGHTRGSVCFYLDKENVLFSGDHILPHITPNAFPMLERENIVPSRSSQIEFYKSLEIIEKLNPAAVYPAHGKTIRDFHAVHAMYKACFAERQKTVLETIKANPGETVYAMARILFPEINDSHRFLLDLYLAVSEVFTHIQVLERLEKVRTRIVNRTLRAEENP
jgi:glyoxylase-like metal-dependent hydrolase (beta-lactamase superfamily II)